MRQSTVISSSGTRGALASSALAIAALTLLAVADLRAQGSLSDNQRVTHVLTRLGYGPRPGDVARVRAMGIEAYIDEQLHPERLADGEVRARLEPYRVLGMKFEDLLAYDLPPTPLALRRRSSVLERGLEPPKAKAAVMGEDVQARLRAQILNPQALGRVVRAQADRPLAFEYIETRLLRAVYSERQLLELLADFWMNHFNITTGDPYLLADFEENAIRPRALGKFHDLLLATATHPAMLLYLDNWLSTAPEEVVRARVASGGGSGTLVDGALALRARSSYLAQAKGLNENYARELMELHTVGVDGGYTQDDVLQVARAFTGWTISGWTERQDGSFVFDPALHEAGDKVVMGRTIPEGGMDEGLAILDMLAHHPSTARFISTKLARRFVADDPPAAVVEAAARTFQETGGDIREVLRTIFRSPEFFSTAAYQSKVKKPIEMVASALRAVDADIDTRFETTIQPGNNQGRGLFGVMAQMGERLYGHEAPDGFPDVASAWVSTNALFQRLRFSLDLVTGQLPGITGDIDAASQLFRDLGYPEVTPEQVAAARRLMAASGQEAQGAGGMMADRMTDVSAEAAAMYSPLVKAPAAATPEQVAALEARAIALAFLLGSPQFQKR